MKDKTAKHGAMGAHVIWLRSQEGCGKRGQLSLVFELVYADSEGKAGKLPVWSHTEGRTVSASGL
jgi:hypothetical protein